MEKQSIININKKAKKNSKENIIFLWIPKTAGYSIWDKLKKSGNYGDKLYNDPLKFNNQKIVTFGHIYIPSLLSKGVISRDYFDNSFKFTFVRNPWDRLVSLFFYCKRRNRPQVQNITFDLFCHQLKKNIIEPIGFSNVQGLSQFNQQIRWLLDRDSKLLVNFIGKYENLNYDFKKMCDILNIKYEPLLRLNPSSHKHYSRYYTKGTRRIVSDLYKEDIENFDYSFKDCSSFHSIRQDILFTGNNCTKKILKPIKKLTQKMFPYFYSELRRLAINMKKAR